MITHADIATASAIAHSPDTLVLAVAGKTYIRSNTPPDHSDAFQDASGAVFVAGGITRELAVEQATAWFASLWGRVFGSSALNQEREVLAEIALRCSHQDLDIASHCRGVLQREADLYGVPVEDRIAAHVSARVVAHEYGTRLSLVRQAAMIQVGKPGVDLVDVLRKTREALHEASSRLEAAPPADYMADVHWTIPKGQGGTIAEGQDQLDISPLLAMFQEVTAATIVSNMSDIAARCSSPDETVANACRVVMDRDAARTGQTRDQRISYWLNAHASAVMATAEAVLARPA